MALAQPPSDYVGRFAPSPTGPLHFGSLLAAVGSYLQARRAHGRWLIRIEDLDTPRTIPGAADHIIATLASFGFAWDGAIEYQSRRLERYVEAFETLRRRKRTYYCTCSRAQIAAAQETARSEATVDELPYPGTCRQRGNSAENAAIRVRVPPGDVSFVDPVQGRQSQDVASAVGDFVVVRRDGIFAYHLAVVVDDAAQGITEVVRGADLLGSTPRQIVLQRLLGMSTPSYCHLPLAVDAHRRKLSKSEQSCAIDPKQAGSILWLALATLKQSPPTELRRAPPGEIWCWALANWTLEPLNGLAICRAPEPIVPADN